MMESTVQKYILLVDDEQNILLALKRELHQWARDKGFEILMANSGKEGLARLDEFGPLVELIISDLRMPEMKGSDFLIEAKRRFPEVLALILSGYSDMEEVVKVIGAGIYSYMLKPWDSAYLLAEVNKAWDVKQAKVLAHQRALLIEEELKWAGELQRTILKPNLPSSNGIEFRVTYRPAPGLFCGGDYYDVISMGHDRYLVLIGEVAGHGVQSAMITAILKAVIYPEYIRTLVGKPFSPADFLGWLNARMQFEFRSTNPVLISFCAALIDLPGRSVLYANAGACHPVLVNHASQELPVSGPSLGESHSVIYIEKHIRLGAGDILLCYTDGLIGTASSVQIQDILSREEAGSDWHKRLLQTALSLRQEADFSDGVTIVTAKVL